MPQRYTSLDALIEDLDSESLLEGVFSIEDEDLELLNPIPRRSEGKPAPKKRGRPKKPRD